MPTDDEIFKTQIKFLEHAVEILDTRAQEIEKNERASKYSDKSEAEIKAIIAVFKVRSIKLYKDTLFYIAEQAVKDDLNSHFFLLPHVRTLLDIYGRFIHLLEKCKDESQQALTCLAYQLLLFKHLNSEPDYLKILSSASNFLSKIGFSFPTVLLDYGHNWVKKNNLAFAKMRDLLTVVNMKKYSINVFTMFGTMEQYGIYSAFSEYLHGNPYYYYESPTNEKFWVIAECISTTAFLIELIDLQTLKKTNPKDFRLWLTDIQKNKSDFVKLWNDRRLAKK